MRLPGPRHGRGRGLVGPIGAGLAEVAEKGSTPGGSWDVSAKYVNLVVEGDFFAEKLKNGPVVPGENPCVPLI